MLILRLKIYQSVVFLNEEAPIGWLGKKGLELIRLGVCHGNRQEFSFIASLL